MSVLGVWLVGASGNVATCTVAGWAALRAGAFEPIGVVSMSAPFGDLDFPSFDDCVFGGAEISERTMSQTLKTLVAERVLSADAVALSEPAIAACQRLIVPGIAAAASYGEFETVCQQLRAFKAESGADRVIVLNLASTEADSDQSLPPTWAELESALKQGAMTLAPSVAYAAAAFETGCSFVNFTPSQGSSAPALQQLAEARGVTHAGCDGKTGETLIKTALAPMFAARRLRVDSWFGQNILGNNDGRTLSEDAPRESKLRSKRAAVNDILGYPVETAVNIDYLPSFGDWKVAWNYIHFRGFGGTRMSMEFTWRGCDTALAAPLCIDLIRFVDHSVRKGERGLLAHLGVFFKSPMGSSEHELSAQYRTLCDHYLVP